ncbi:MAG: permease-like cell division protein FtsX [Patescibacteria group bacterium]|nr:permease-like cell division protein FtsX [Patescibacteria group bacterium]
MSFVSATRVVRFAFQDFLRNFWLSAATVSVLVLTLVSVNLIIVFNVLGNIALTTVKSKIDVSVYFKPEVEENRVQTVKIALLALPEVKDVEFLSAAQALERFSAAYQDDQQVIASLGEVGGNPLGAALVIKARSLDSYPRIMQLLSDPAFAPLIDERDYDDRQQMIRRLEAISDRIQLFGVGASIVFFLITLLIVFNTIRVCIYTHKEEIGIMRLVGASDWFIRGPFYAEAVIWSVLALGVVAALLYPALAFAQPHLQVFFDTANVDLVGFYGVNFWRIFGAQLLAVIAMALVTTKIATAKYLRV